MKCFVVNCPNKNSSKIPDCSFFTFPSNRKLLKLWMKFCRCDEILNPRTSYICNYHFKREDFENNIKFEMGFATKRILKRGAIPTLNRDPSKIDALSEEREKRLEKRRNKQVVEALLREYDASLAASKEGNKEQSCSLLGNNSTPDCDPLELTNTVEEFAKEEEECVTYENVDMNEICKEDLIKIIENMETEVSDLRKQNLRLRKTEQKCVERLREKRRNYSRAIWECVSQIKSLKLSLQKAAHKNLHMEDQLACMFTKGQIQKIKNGFKRKTWSKADISHCIDLYVASPKAYRLLYMRGFPIPAIRTLQKWNQKGIPTSQLHNSSSNIDYDEK